MNPVERERLLREADLEITQMAVERGLAVKPRTDTNVRLKDALERCFEAYARLDEIVANVPQAEDPDNEVEAQAREWQKGYIRQQVTRAHRAAVERKAKLASLKTQADYDAENEKCGDGITGTLYWFRYYAWAYDPRADYLPLQPYVPFGAYEDDTQDFQKRYLEWLEDCTFVKRTSGLIEKARDVGATLGWILWATHHWLFYHYFSGLLSSANEDLVDNKKDQDTLFEKIRFALRLQPTWLLPKGFQLDRDLTYMQISNPVNGSTLNGFAPTQNAGRQRRATAVLKDESAAWPFGGFPQATALSQTSRSIFDVSSVQGRFNQFAVMRHSGRANVFIVDWSEHPWKDKRWFDALEPGFVGSPMTTQQVAQEVLRDYDASQPGKVFKEWEETRIVITQAELLAFYDSHKLGDRFRHTDGTFKIPDDCEWARMQDRGETEGHPRMTLWCFRPAKRYPLSDSVFFFAEHQAPTAADLGTVVTELKEVQRQFQLNTRTPEISINSHEAKEDRRVYQNEFGWHWASWNTDYNAGIGQIRLWIKPVDLNKPNPIRPVLMGRSRVYLVCTNEEAKLFYNQKDKKHFVSPAGTSKGFIRLRAEMPVYHYPPEELGKALKDQRPEKIFDDGIDCVRSIATKWGPTAAPLTHHEEVIAAIPEQYQYDKLAAQTGGKGLTPEAELAYVFQLDRAKKAIGPAVLEVDEWINVIGLENDE